MQSPRLQLHADYFSLVNNWSASADYGGQMEKLNVLPGAWRAQLDAGQHCAAGLSSGTVAVVACNKDITENNRAMEDAAADLRILLKLKGDTQIILVDSLQSICWNTSTGNLYKRSTDK